MAAGTPSLLHVEAAAVAAATAAAPSRKRKSAKRDNSSLANKHPKSISSNSKSAAGMMEFADEQPSQMSASATALIDKAMQQAEPIAESTQHHNTYDNNNNTNNAAMTAQQKAQSSREKNREHARCTRLRKKAYVNKLKELVDGLHAERSEDTRKRRLAVQALASVQEVSTLS